MKMVVCNAYTVSRNFSFRDLSVLQLRNVNKLRVESPWWWTGFHSSAISHSIEVARVALGSSFVPNKYPSQIMGSVAANASSEHGISPIISATIKRGG